MTCLWDEAGNGNNHKTHAGFYKSLLKYRDIDLPQDHFNNLYSWQGLTGYNVFMLGASNRLHYYKSIVTMAMTELLDSLKYTKLIHWIKTLGMNEEHAKYYAEHISIDVEHADGWLSRVIFLLLKYDKSSANEIFLGAYLRLNLCANYYDHFLSSMKES